MGGELHLRSVEGQGSTFEMTLPFIGEALEEPQVLVRRRVLVVEPSMRQRAVPLAITPPVSHFASVLVVDDNPINLRVATAMLERLGCRVTTAKDGRAAVEAWKRSKWDLIFMDCQMPELDGYEATAQLRALESAGRRTPIVAMTANAGADDRVRCLSHGMDGFIAKPCRSRDFEEALERWVPVGRARAESA
jgi:CheY-like chemotaxis protein